MLRATHIGAGETDRWPLMTEGQKDLYRADVRAVLLSIRVPDKSMRLAVNDAALKKAGMPGGWMSTSVDAWQEGHAAAIDSILKETP